MRTLLLIAVALLPGCNCGGPTCEPTSPADAGSQLRALGEPCTDGFACADGLSCQNTSRFSPHVQRECLAPCGDAGTCAAGAACLDGDCHPSCTTDSDCTSRFSASCVAVDAGAVRGFCASLSCSRTQACPNAGVCVLPPYCCPPGAPCVAPQDGFCLR